MSPSDRYHLLTGAFLAVCDLSAAQRAVEIRRVLLAPDLLVDLDQLLSIHDYITCGAATPAQHWD